MKPLVSILIPAYNAERTIASTLQSAIAQTWDRKEIIVVNDGSTDRTLEIVERFVPQGVRVFSTENRGLSAAVNHAIERCQGDYVQELDADDMLAPDKIERQLAALRPGDSKRILLSSPWAYFFHRPQRARFIPNSLWHDLSPVEWLLRKMGENLHMQNATWLVGREVIEAAGPWDTDLHYDQDGEYFSRVLVASEGTRFVPETGIFYRLSGSTRISYIGNSKKKKASLLRSMKLHIQYLRSLEDSERVRKACLSYLQKWFDQFYPEMPDLMEDMQSLAQQLGGHLDRPKLTPKYSWLEPILGFRAAKWAQMTIPNYKDTMLGRWDGVMTLFEKPEIPAVNASHLAPSAQQSPADVLVAK